jgi:hypothetical protein
MKFGQAPEPKLMTLVDLDSRKLTFENYQKQLVEPVPHLKSMSQQFENFIINRAEDVFAGGSHEFSSRGLELLQSNYQAILNRRYELSSMEVNALHHGTKE